MSNHKLATALRNELLTQDNAITADPIFLVEERRRIYGIDPGYTDEIAWLYADEAVEVDPAEAEELEAAYQESRREPEGYTRAAYVDEWRYVQPFFTRKAAEEFIARRGHSYPHGLRVFVDSGCRNPEWKAVRALLGCYR